MMFGFTQYSRMRGFGMRLLGFLILLGCPRGVLAQTWRWTIEDVDARAEQTSIVADKEGNVHLAYYMPDNGGQLRYAFRSAAEGGWYKDTLDQHLGVFSTGIAMDANDNPGICYTPRRIKYTHWRGHKWAPLQEVDPDTGLIAYHCSIKYSSADLPRISWYLESIFVLRYAAREESSWIARSVEVGQQSGKWNSLFLDQNNYPHIAFSSFNKLTELHYAYFDGKDWVRSVVDSSPPGAACGMGASLVLDAQGNPRVSYHDLKSLKYAHLDNGKWVLETVEMLPPYVEWTWKNFSTTLLLDRNGNPHISYESQLGLKHAWWDGKRWHTQLIRPSLGLSIFENSMAMDLNDNLYIAFREPADGSLKVAVARPTAVPETASALKKGDSQD
jgi:hypothetical protein